MRPGTWSLKFRPDVPISVTNTISDLIDESSATGYGGHIVITNTRVDPAVIGDAAVLAAASYTGRIMRRPSRLSLEGVGLGSWLDTYIDAQISRTSGTLANWLTDLLVNDLSQGTVGTATAEALDTVMGLAGAEYRILPDFTVDSDDATTLFTSPPTVVVTRKAEGPDGTYRGVEGGLLDQSIDVSTITTKVAALAEGSGSSMQVATSSNTPNLNAPKGSAPDLVTVINAPGEESGNAATLAANYKALLGKRTEVKIASTTHHLPRHVIPGDEVYVYDVTSGLVDTDTSNQIHFRGETITPAQVRLLSYTWPVEHGVGVYLRSNETTAVYTDLTDWVEWERGTTWWTVGDWKPPTYGRSNRANPEVEQRVGAGWHDFVPTFNNLPTSSTDGAYMYTDGGMWIKFSGTASGAATGGVSVDVPNSETGRSDGVASLGRARYIDATGADTDGGCYVSAGGTTIILESNALVQVSASVPFTWASSDVIRGMIFVSL
jgi:hypothetical protein